MQLATVYRLIGWVAFLGALFLLRGAFTIVYLTLIFGWTTAVLLEFFPRVLRATGWRRNLLVTLLHVTVIGSACAVSGAAVAYLAEQGAAAFDSTRHGDPEGALRDSLRRALASIELYRSYGPGWATSVKYQKERDDAWDDEVSGHRADCLRTAASAQVEAPRIRAEFDAYLGKQGAPDQKPLTPAARDAAYEEYVRSQRSWLSRMTGRPGACAPPTLALLADLELVKDDAGFEQLKDRWFLELKAVKLAAEAGASNPLSAIVDVVSKTIPMVAGWLGSIVSGLLGMGLDVVCAIVFSLLVLWALPDLDVSLAMLGGTYAGAVWAEVKFDLWKLGEALFNGFVALVIIGALNGLVAGALLRMCGVDGALYLGFIVLMCSLIPYLGKLIAAVPLCLVAFSQGGSHAGARAFGVLVIAHVLETLIWNPFVLSRWLKLTPLTVTLVQIPGQIAFGLWGLLLAPPVAEFVWELALRSRPDQESGSTTRSTGNSEPGAGGGIISQATTPSSERASQR